MRLLACLCVSVYVLVLGRSVAHTAECGKGLVQCGNSDQCVGASWLCTGEVSCDNGWDELNCTSCHQDSFLCDGSRCVENRHKCDGVAWCRDGTDESNCTNIKSKPVCEASSRCNGVWDDCVTKDSELDCTPEMCQAPATREAFSGGRCREPIARCNGVLNFPDENDELNCTECNGGALFCDGRCLPSKEVCDGWVDCSSGEDELNCTDCKDLSFLCDGSRCVHNIHTCDGVAWCNDGSDEAKCSRMQSEPVCQASSRCDGVWGDCYTKDDEIACTPKMCQVHANSTTFCDGRCLKASSWCDGKPDCSDGQDEARCSGTLPLSMAGT